MERLQSQWKMSCTFSVFIFWVLKAKKLKIYLKGECNIFEPFQSLQFCSASKSRGTVFEHWGPCAHLGAKMQIKKNLLLSCVSHQQRWGYCQGSDATINLASQARKQLSPREFVKILSLTLLGFVVCSRLECSSCGTGDVWALWHKGLFQQPVLLSMGEGLCLPLPRRGK